MKFNQKSVPCLDRLPCKESLFKLILEYIFKGWPIQERFCHFLCLIKESNQRKSSPSNASALKADVLLAGQAATRKDGAV